MLWTRELLLKAAGFAPVEDLTHALRATRDALQATQGRKPDHRIRLEAADRIFDLADVRKRRESDADPSRPVSVTLVLSAPVNGHARTALPSGGVTLHLTGGDE